MENAIGRALRGARAEAGLTQIDIASRLDTSHVSVSAWERGKSQISFARAITWADACNVSLDRLAGRAN